MSIGERIKKRRKELGMTADDLGMAIGKDRTTVYRYEKGVNRKATNKCIRADCRSSPYNTSISYGLGKRSNRL